MRSQNHATTSAETAPTPQKIIRHDPPAARTPWPNAGAKIGAAMNTMKARLITRAIARPAKQSRTKATVTTRAPAAEAPIAARATSSSTKLPEIAASALVST
jgi:hypothetical protein